MKKGTASKGKAVNAGDHPVNHHKRPANCRVNRMYSSDAAGHRNGHGQPGAHQAQKNEFQHEVLTLAGMHGMSRHE